GAQGLRRALRETEGHERAEGPQGDCGGLRRRRRDQRQQRRRVLRPDPDAGPPGGQRYGWPVAPAPPSWAARAIAVDPASAPAYAALAQVHAFAAEWYGGGERAREAADHAGAKAVALGVEPPRTAPSTSSARTPTRRRSTDPAPPSTATPAGAT